ncbi:MAG TPA: alpha/beta hydrolase [Mycobacteriales bacterium]|nr:alpha/beta hydrolase [Mycobacteriales bacterium]
MADRRLAAAAVALLLAVAGCSAQSAASGGGGGSPTAAGSAPRAAAAAGLGRFYRQRLQWHGCDGQFQCSSLTVPVDYRHPRGHTIRLAVIRKPATDGAQRALVVNPGGPGASGVSFVEEDSSIFSRLASHDDLVSFDPRGVGRSHPIRCVSAGWLDRYIDQPPVPRTRAQRAQTVALARHLANACYRRNGRFLAHVATVDEARDMDVLRAALGEPKLTYYGASYGTYLGARYAGLFPGRVRAMVLDGALDPAASSTEANLAQARGFNADLRDFLSSCVASGSCPLGSSVAAATAGVSRLLAQLTAHPLSVGDRQLGPGEFFEGLAAGMYAPTSWPSLRLALAAVRAGNGRGLLAFSDALTERHPDGSYSNLLEANVAINCVDRPSPRRVSTYAARARQFARQAPLFGAAIEWGALPCAFWRVPAVAAPRPVHAAGTPPILVIGTTRDPATPYVWAKALARELANGVLLTYDGDGHTAYLRGNTCVDGAVDSYLDDLQVPKPGTRCG